MGAGLCSKVKQDLEAEAKQAEDDAKKWAASVASLIMTDIKSTLLPEVKAMIENALKQAASQAESKIQSEIQHVVD